MLFRRGKTDLISEGVRYNDCFASDMAGRPNYFLCLRIQDKQLVSRLVDAQRQIVSRYPFYEDHIIPSHSFHITLPVLSLKGNNEMQSCAATLQRMSGQLAQHMRNIGTVEVRGLGDFGPKTLLAKVTYTEAFKNMVDDITASFSQWHVSSHGSFEPHVTLFKVPYQVSLPAEAALPNWDGERDLQLGSVPFDNVLLCKMGTLTQNEFYRVEADIKL